MHDDDDDDATSATPLAPTPSSATDSVAAPATSITLVTYDSWTDALDTVLATFTADTGIAVEVLRAGDTGTMVSKAVLTAGNPEGDVMFGVDNTFLSRASRSTCSIRTSPTDSRPSPRRCAS